MISEIIGDEITSNPIQHIRLKPPSKLLHKEESRAHITYTDWHQARGVALKIADKTQMVTVWVAITDSNIKQLSNSEYMFANISIGVLLTRNFLYCILTSFIGSVPKTVTHKIHLFNLVL